MKAAQIIILFLIAIIAGTFIYLSAGESPESILFERIDRSGQPQYMLIIIILFLLLFILVRFRKSWFFRLHHLEAVVPLDE